MNQPAPMIHEQPAALVAVGIRPGPHSLQDEQVVFLHVVDDAAFDVGDAFRGERGPDRFGLRRGEPELFEHPALESPPPAASVSPDHAPATHHHRRNPHPSAGISGIVAARHCVRRETIDPPMPRTAMIFPTAPCSASSPGTMSPGRATTTSAVAAATTTTSTPPPPIRWPS